MKRAGLALFIFLAAAPAARGQTGLGGPPLGPPTQSRTAPLNDVYGSTWGSARVSLWIESGLFVVRQPGRLRAFPRRYLYRVENLDLWGGNELVLDRFEPSACGIRYLALPPTQLAGDFGAPEAWEPTTWGGVGDRRLFWGCSEPYSEGLFPESTFQFELYSDAEPTFAPITLGGWDVERPSFWPTPVRAEIHHVVPGCLPAPPAMVPEFDLEMTVHPPQVTPGHVATFTIRARNVGREQATGVMLQSALPAGLIYLPGSLTHNGEPVADGGANPLIRGMRLGILAPRGGGLEVAYRARVAAGLEEGKLLASTARLSCDQTASLESGPASLRVGPPDRTPPTLTIAAPRAATYPQHETLTIAFEASDADPGLVPGETRATLDGRPVQSGDTIVLFDLAPGPHTFLLTALDRAGNRATRQITFEVAATISSTIEQVLRARAAGGIRTDQTMGTLNALLLRARERLQAGDRAGALQAIENFKRSVTSYARRGWRPGAEGTGLIDEPTVVLLSASADYLLQNPAP